MKVDPAKTKLLKEFKHTAPLIGCRFDPTGQYVFAGAQDNGVHRWDLATGKKATLTGHKSWVRALAFDPGSTSLLSADWTGKILFWPLQGDNPSPRQSIEAHRGWVRALAVSPDGKTLASCGNDRLVRLWSLPDGKPIKEFTGHETHVYNVAFHPDGQSLVSADLKGVLRHWNLKTGKQQRQLDASVLYKYDNTFRADIGGVRSMAFSPEGDRLACAGITDVTNAFAGVGKPLVVLFDWKSGTRKVLMRPKEAFQGTAWGVRFHPDGFVLAAGAGSGGALWAWKMDEATSFFTLKLPNNARDLDLHPDKQRLAIPYFDGALRVYSLG